MSDIEGQKIFSIKPGKSKKGKKMPSKESEEAILAEEMESKESLAKDRGSWTNQFEFFLSCLSYAIGFGNIWRFPYLCYKNGGAVFLIPYVIMLLLAGLPMFFMELVIGQYASLGPTLVFRELAPIFSGLGWAMVMVSLLVAIYFNVILAWTLFYISSSFTTKLPWGHCDNPFNSESCFTYAESDACQKQSLFYYGNECHNTTSYCAIAGLDAWNDTHCFNVNQTEVIPAIKSVPRIVSSEDFYRNRMLHIGDATWDNMGAMNWEMVGFLALGWIIIGGIIAKGIKSSGKTVYFTAMFPYIVMMILFIRGITLEGHEKGIDFYLLRANTSKLWEGEVWMDAATQIFYSLGIAFGGLMTLASYNKFRHNCMRDACIIAVANCSTSIFAGFTIFTMLGFMANEIGVDVKDVVNSGSGLVFIVYPTALTMMPFPPIWAVLFFLMFMTVGLGTQITMVETVSTAIFDQFPVLRPWKPLVVFFLCFTLFLCGITMCLEGGVYMFELFQWYTAGVSLLIVAITEVLLIQYVFGFQRFMKLIRYEMEIYIPRPLYVYFGATWLVTIPLSLFAILVLTIYSTVPASWGNYIFPNSIQALGWGLCAASVVCLPIFALWVLIVDKKRGRALIESTIDFCPAHLRMRTNNILTSAETTGQLASCSVEKAAEDRKALTRAAESFTSISTSLNAAAI